VADDFWREAVALKRYRSHPMMLIGDEPQSYPSYCDIAGGRLTIQFTVRFTVCDPDVSCTFMLR
jgi:hypothetical protein